MDEQDNLTGGALIVQVAGIGVVPDVPENAGAVVTLIQAVQRYFTSQTAVRA